MFSPNLSNLFIPSLWLQYEVEANDVYIDLVKYCAFFDILHQTSSFITIKLKYVQ